MAKVTKLVMRRSEKSSKKSVALQKPTQVVAALQVAAPQKRGRDELIDGLLRKSCQVTGTRTHELSDRIITQLGYALVWPEPKGSERKIVEAFAAIAEMAPQNATEAMLATQMIAVNDAALMFLRRATLESQSFEGVNANVQRTTRLMGLFNDQLDAMQKLKGKTGQQRVRVEHVHVYNGGQAIVGTVATGQTGPEGGG